MKQKKLETTTLVNETKQTRREKNNGSFIVVRRTDRGRYIKLRCHGRCTSCARIWIQFPLLHESAGVYVYGNFDGKENCTAPSNC